MKTASCPQVLNPLPEHSNVFDKLHPQENVLFQYPAY
jgi:hypothetical protein